MVGTTVSHYRILEKLGEGGMGVVYKAEDTLLKRTVALKFLPPQLTSDVEAKKRFIHEAQAASALDSPHICNIHEVAETEEGQTFIAMGYYEGETLKKRIERGPIPITEAVNIISQVASGLGKAHEKNIIHRDIKPANIVIATDGIVKIVDFGLAKLSGQTHATKPGSTMGTPAYISPEQARWGIADQRTDIWSLGVMLYEMLTGRKPFESDHDQALVYMILNEEPAPIRSWCPEVPKVLEEIVRKAMAKDPNDRYQNVEDLLADLGVVAPTADDIVTGLTIAGAEVVRKKRKRHQKHAIVLSLALLPLVAVAVFVVVPFLHDQALTSNPRTIAFISFENQTGDESLAYLRNVLPDLLGTSLGESKYMRVMRSDRMRDMMKQIGKDSVEFIDRQTGLLLCRRAGINMMAAGTYTKAGPMFLAELELVDVNTGEQVGSTMKARGQEVESFLKENGIVDELAGQISRGMGVSKLNTRASLKPVAEVSSSSMEAQRFFQRGKVEQWKFNIKESRHYLEQAVKEDSTFAIAWLWLGDVCAGDPEAAQNAHDHANRYFSRASDKEKFWIARHDLNLRDSLLKNKGMKEEGTNSLSFAKACTEVYPYDAEFRFWYANLLANSGESEKAIVEYEKTLELDPSMTKPYNELGYMHAFCGRCEKAMEMLDHLAELLPGEPDPLQSAAEVLMLYGRYPEAFAKCEAAILAKPDHPNTPVTLSKLYFITEDYGEAIEWANRASEVALYPEYRIQRLWWPAFYLVWAGRLKEAEASLQMIVRTASAEGDQGLVAQSEWLQAWCAYEKGNWKKSRLLFQEYATIASSLGTRTLGRWFSQFCLGLVDVQQGMTDSVDVRLERMKATLFSFAHQAPADSEEYEDEWRFFGNALNGARLLATHHPQDIQLNWKPSLFSFQQSDSFVTANWPLQVPGVGYLSERKWIPIPFDIMPRAYVERGMIDSAIVSYERAIRKPANLLGPIIPRYYYRLARLYEQKGMKEKAVENYTKFLRVWGTADPIYKEPAEARARLARLRQVH